VRLARRVLRRVGFDVRRVEPAPPALDLREVTEDPVEACYRSGGRPFIVDVPLASCRMMKGNAFLCVPGSGNPLVETVLAYRSGRSSSYAGSPLEAFYDSWQPSTLAEALGIAVDGASPGLRVPAHDAPPVPWSDRARGSRREERLNRPGFVGMVERDGAVRGPIDGMLYYGPVSTAFGEVTFRRLASLADSIDREGYLPDRYGFLQGRVLVRQGSWRILVDSGKHRAAVLGGLDLHSVPLLFGNGRRRPVVVHRNDVDSWPNVRNALFTSRQALDVFDRIFDGRPIHVSS
jgi:hypothetical protein